MLSHLVRLNFLVSVAIVFLIVFFGQKEFFLWSQVTYLWEIQANPFEMQPVAHLGRYLLTYPIFVAAEVFDIVPDKLFSYTLVAIYFLNVRLLLTNLDQVHTFSKKSAFIVPLAAPTILLCFYLLANGRGPLALMGFSLIMSYVLKQDGLRANLVGGTISLCVGFLLCSVSTGVFTSSFLIVITSVFFRLGKNFLAQRVISWDSFQPLVTSIVLIFLSKYLWISVEKNLLFYGGGFQALLRMFDHGVGSHIVSAVIFLPGEFFLSILVIGYFVVLMLWILMFRSAVGLYPALASISGIYGYTTLIMALVPLLFLCHASNERIPAGRV